MLTHDGIYGTELYEYLETLHALLQKQRQAELASVVERPMCFAGGSMSEFFYEAEVALKAVKERLKPVLSSDEYTKLLDVLRRIDYEFRKIGGA